MIGMVLMTYRAAILPTRMILEIAEADAHVMMQRVWHGHGNA
jgi:hypothetical protein